MLASAIGLSPGDLVYSSADKDTVGLIVSVRETNTDSRFNYPYIYYVLFTDDCQISARFCRELEKL